MAANQRGGVLPIPWLWPQSGLSNAVAGWNSTQTPGEISFIVSSVRHSGTGMRCSRVLLLRSKSSCKYSALKRLRDPLRGGRSRPVDAAIGVERGPDGRRAQAQRNDEKQTGDKLKHEAHAITLKVW